MPAKNSSSKSIWLPSPPRANEVLVETGSCPSLECLPGCAMAFPLQEPMNGRLNGRPPAGPSRRPVSDYNWSKGKCNRRAAEEMPKAFGRRTMTGRTPRKESCLVIEFIFFVVLVVIIIVGAVQPRPPEEVPLGLGSGAFHQ